MILYRLLFCLALLTTVQSFGQEEVPELVWPREVDTKDGGIVTFYQPQVDSYVANILEGRSAISYQPKDGEMVFGAFWFRAFLQVDKEARTAILDQIDITDVQFPELVDSVKTKQAQDFIQEKIESMDIVMSLDRLIASLDEAENIQTISENINNDPPKIYYRDEPTILVTIDGEPIWKELKDQNLKYCENSAFFISQDLKSGLYYINGGNHWYSTETPPTGWELTEKVSKNIREFAEANAPKTPEDEETKEENSVAPELLVVYEPSEVLVTDGKAEYASIEGTQLLYVSNTESDIIMEIGSQKHYVLLAGRWYKSNQLESDDWTFANPSDLPEEFKNIPAESDMASVRASVPETDEAKDALLEQTIPQTAEVSRKDTKIEVKFDGSPKFKNIPNTDVAYAENSDKQVMKIDQKFYVVDNGIWFVSSYATGPYEVSDHRPEEVDQLPPDSPVYNTKYVYVYNSTPEVVYVGYTPGYTYSYVYGGVVVYGTGYSYPYWYGSVYYPRPVTYGFNVHYNPYSGWGFSVGFSTGGWVGWGYHPYYRPYWGPCGYHAGYRHGYYHGYNHGYNRGYAQGYARGMNQGNINSARNAYRNQPTGVRNTTNRGQLANRDVSRPSSRPNNMYSDKKGNVYQRDNKGNYNQMKNGGANKAGNTRPSTTPSTKPGSSKPSTQPSTRPSTQPSTRPSTNPSTRPSTQPTNKQSGLPYNKSSQQSRQNNNYDFNKSHQSRQRGNTNYQQHRSAPTRSAPTRSAPSRGGGGRRR